MDDEYLSSIKDFTKGSPIIYSTNNPVIDGLSPSMLWKASSSPSSSTTPSSSALPSPTVTINKVLPMVSNPAESSPIVSDSTGNKFKLKNKSLFFINLFIE